MVKSRRPLLKTLALLSGLLPFVLSTASADTISNNNPAQVFAANTNVVNAQAATPPPPVVGANGYILVDATTGQILAAKNIDQRMAPASLTKMMSLYLIATALQSGQIKPTDLVTVSKTAWQTGGSRMFIRVGSKVAVQDLIQGIIVDSGNDATMAMAEYLAGSADAFVPLMNNQAQSLGMMNTHYSDPTGLPDPNHYSSPRDMAILARAFISNYPQFYTHFKQQYFTYDNITQSNRNKLLWRDPSVDGIKTGFTDDAGYCLVASAVRDGTRLISVVMGAPTNSDRYDFNQTLLNYGFRFFKTHHVYTPDEAVTQARAWMGQDKYVNLGVSKELAVTIPVGKYQDVKANIVLNKLITAPVVKGQAYGQLTLTLNNQTLAAVPLVAMIDNPKGGLITRFSDYLTLTFHNMFNHGEEEAQQQPG